MSDSEEEITIMSQVEKWATAKKLSAVTIAALIDLGFDSMEALSLLTEEDLSDTDVPRGQRKLLLHAVKSTFPDGAAAKELSAATGGINRDQPQPPAEDAGQPLDTGDGRDQGQFINDVLRQLQQPTDTPVATSNLPGMYSWQDPQVYLKSLDSLNLGASNYLDITDFVNQSSATEERVVSRDGEGQLIYKSGPAKPKLESLSICQWSTANLAIMNKLLQGGTLSHHSLLDYLSYTTRIYQLLSAHDTRSVFLYDREYRKLQSLHKFRWGTDIPHLQMVHLKARSAQPFQSNQGLKSRPNSQPYPARASHNAQGVEICKRFNARKGCSVVRCRFDHACSVPGCGQAHPAFDHNIPSRPKNQ